MRTPFKSIKDARGTTVLVLDLLEEEQIKERFSKSEIYAKYKFFYKKVKPREVRSRPVNSDLFIQNPRQFEVKFGRFFKILGKIKAKKTFTDRQRELVNSVLYTMGVGFGIGADFVMDPNEARKNVGERFGDLIECIFKMLGLTYSSETRPYGKSQIDFIVSPYSSVKSGKKSVDTKEMMISVKTTSKDRFKLIFSDKEGLESASEKKINWIAIFLYDVQRKGKNGVAKTFVPGRFLNKDKASPLTAVYYLDPPRNYESEKFGKKIKTLDKLIFEDFRSFYDPPRTFLRC